MRSSTVIASTLGLDAAEIGDYHYQPSRLARPAVYSIGDCYYACGVRMPRHAEYEWTPHPDQFWAKQCKTVLWVGRGAT